jgi:GT2 family glycosyltransferase
MTQNYKCSSFCSYYKGEKFVQGYIDDVLRQTLFDQIEFVFLDCNSPENEKEYIIPLTEKYSNIKYYKLDSDPGLYAGWNHAISLCSAPIVGNWNIDDRKNAFSFELLLKAFEREPDLDLVYGITYMSYKANEKYEDNDYSEIYAALPHTNRNLLMHNSPHCMPLWKKSIHDRFGFFDTKYLTAADGDMWLRIAGGGARIKMVNHPVGLYYHNPTGRSSNPDTLNQMVKEVMDMRRKYTHMIGDV